MEKQQNFHKMKYENTHFCLNFNLPSLSISSFLILCFWRNCGNWYENFVKIVYSSFSIDTEKRKKNPSRQTKRKSEKSIKNKQTTKKIASLFFILISESENSDFSIFFCYIFNFSIMQMLEKRQKHIQNRNQIEFILFSVSRIFYKSFYCFLFKLVK